MKTDNATATPPANVSLAEAFAYWLWLGCISFGGPTGQIAIMHQDLVEKKRWISEQRFLHALNYCMVLPGPEAQQLAIYIGWLMHKTLGGIIAGTLFVLPSLFVLIGLSWIYMAYGDVPAIAGILLGIKPAVMVVVMVAATRLARKALKKPWMGVLALASFAGLVVWQVDFPLIVLSAALTGWIVWRVRPDWIVAPSGSHVSPSGSAAATSSGPDRVGYIFDDETPLPEHAQFRARRVLQVGVIGGLCVAVPLLILMGLWGTEHVLSRMGVFFTQAALVTFGAGTLTGSSETPFTSSRRFFNSSKVLKFLRSTMSASEYSLFQTASISESSSNRGPCARKVDSS